METIPSFTKNHDLLMPGFYLCDKNGEIYTYDLRFKKPNSGDFLSQKALHSIEHMLATALRNSPVKENIVYFGPMGCRTGFYLLTKNLGFKDTLSALISALNRSLTFDAVPGSEKQQCGNYAEHDLSDAKKQLKDYLNLLTEEKIYD